MDNPERGVNPLWVIMPSVYILRFYLDKATPLNYCPQPYGRSDFEKFEKREG